MNFYVTTNCNCPSIMYVLYTVPTKIGYEELNDAVKALCHDRCCKLGLNDETTEKRLNAELKMMAKTKTAANFLILHEIADLSHEEMYEINVKSSVAKSLIGFLLSITDINPLKPDLPEEVLDKFIFSENSVWVSTKSPVAPCFESDLAEPVKEKIQSRLSGMYSYIKSDKSIYKKITFTNNWACEVLGDLRRKFGDIKNDEYKDIKVLEAVSNYVINTAETNDKNSDEVSSAVFYNNLRNYSEGLKENGNLNLYTVSRLFAFIYISYTSKKTIDILTDESTFVFREEVQDELRKIGIDSKTAHHLATHGVMRKEKAEYLDLLKTHGASKELTNKYLDLKYLWKEAFSLGRIKLFYKNFYYSIYYPEDFARMKDNVLNKINT